MSARSKNENGTVTGMKKLLKAAGLPELGPGPRTGVLPEKEMNSAVDDFLKGSKLAEVSRELVRGLVLLWHDHIDAAHEIAQAIETPDGSFLHGILHRREPDFGNAAYWFRRVGRHECFPEIARRAGEFLKTRNESAMEKQLIRNGEWNPYGFIGLCEKGLAKGAGDEAVKLLRGIQGIETEVLLEHWLRG